jgi:hypothetical protein
MALAPRMMPDTELGKLGASCTSAKCDERICRGASSLGLKIGEQRYERGLLFR